MTPTARPRNLTKQASFFTACLLALGLLATLVSPARAVVVEGPEPVSISVQDVGSSSPLPNVRVDAWQQITNRSGDKKWRRIGRGHTDPFGKVMLDVDFSKGLAYFFTKPYPVGVKSEVFEANPGTVKLLVGRTSVTVKDCTEQILYGKRAVRAYPVDGTDPLASARADESAVARFDLPFGNKERYVFEVKDPYGSGVMLRSGPIDGPGAVDLCVEESDADVNISVQDAFSKDPMVGVRVFAWRHTLDANGLPALKVIARGDTDGSGVVKLRIDFSRGDVEFSTKPYPREVRSQAYKENPKKVQLFAGSTPVVVKDCKQDTLSSAKPYANLRVTAYQDGNDRPWAGSLTDAGGVARFDPPFGNGESHVFKIKNPNGAGLIQTEPVEKAGPVMLCVDGQDEEPGAISGSVMEDTDNNDSGDTPLEGVTVELHASAGDRVATANPVATTTTDENGTYSFEEVKPGSYQVREQNPAGYVDVGDSDGGDPNNIAVTVKAGGTSSGNNFVDEQVGSISGKVWEDMDDDDIGDTELAGVTVELHDAAGATVLDTATSDASGAYDFENLVPDSYQVHAVTPPNYVAVSPVDIAVTVTAGETSSGNNFVFEQQPASDVETQMRHLINRISYGITPSQLAALNAGTIDIDSYRTEQLDATGCLEPAEAQAIGGIFDNPSYLLILPIATRNDLQNYAILMAAYDDCQLREVLTQFWDNHFSTDWDAVWSKSGRIASQTTAWELAENDAFRANALGNFRDLVEISAKSPAMVHYLDGVDNVVGAPNENYARELMELHTMSVDGGYTDLDVVNVAVAFTGWTVIDPDYDPTADPYVDPDPGNNHFACDPATHDYSDVVLDLGNGPGAITIATPVPHDATTCEYSGQAVIDELVALPVTGEFICQKLTELLVSDDITPSVVGACETAFADSAGAGDQIAQTVEAILTTAEFSGVDDYLDKVKTPLELTAGYLRNFDIVNSDVALSGDLNDLRSEMDQMSMSLFRFNSPDGFPEQSEDWVNSGLMQRRFAFISDMAFNPSPVSDIYLDPVAFFATHTDSSAVQIVDYLMELALQNQHTTLERDAALDILNNINGFDTGGMNFDTETDPAIKANRLRALLGVVLNNPGYQYQ